ncbi:MAG: stage II sporulation protein M [Anaerolineae bacterium]
MRPLKEALQILRDHRRLYLAVNLIYYGLVVVGALVVWLNPWLQASLMTMVQEAFESSLPGVVEAYRGGQFLAAVAQTFSINFFLGSLMVITLPACFFPPAGILVGFWRAFLWGLLLAPTTPQFALVMIPHGLTLLLEGQAYILAIFAACRLGQVLLWPESLGLTSRWRAYLAGLREMALVYILVAIVLLVSALWEAFEVIYIVAPMAGGL